MAWDESGLIGMSEEQYISIVRSGLFWVWYPNATGNYKKDTGVENEEKKELLRED